MTTPIRTSDPSGPSDPSRPSGLSDPSCRVRTHRNRSAAAALVALAAAGALTLTGCGAGDSGDKAVSDSAADKGFAAPREAGGVAAADGRADAKASGGAAAPQSAPGTAGSPAAPAQARQHIIRTATLGIESKDPQKTLAAARSAAEGAGGYVGSETTLRNGNGNGDGDGDGDGGGDETRDGHGGAGMTSTVTLRVPVDRFDRVLAALEGSGKLLHRKVDAQDVTERVVDVDSRVTSQRASVARVREMMEKATAIGDLVTLEGELNKRQTELEALLAQQNALKDQTSLGTITLEVSSAAGDTAADADGDPAFTDALEGGWEVFLAVLKWITLAVGALLPFALAGGVLLALWRAFRRFRPARPAAGAARDRSPAPAGRSAAGLVPYPAPSAERSAGVAGSADRPTERSAAPEPTTPPAGTE
ncbi:DUF4349 domain-containing protein [Streptomyces sp. NPDC089799]|uniref:DUF4349 domain-containing protein n=1 Tax=Streptomyces sp. NPDC089799 TaxID=3155066 RepID=UPI0034392609